VCQSCNFGLESPDGTSILPPNQAGRLREAGYLLGQTDRRTDGVVPYWSAHIDGVESEIVVEADRTSVHRHPLAVLEVRHILLEHLRQAERQINLAKQDAISLSK
jgi:hypothetical protein